MTDIKYDPELPFAVTTKKYPEGTSYVIARFNNEQDAVDWAESPFPGGHEDGTEVIDTTPKPKIPEGAEYITWSDPYDNGEERIAMRYGHPANKVWRVGVDTLDELHLLKDWIGDAEVTVLVRKEDS